MTTFEKDGIDPVLVIGRDSTIGLGELASRYLDELDKIRRECLVQYVSGNENYSAEEMSAYKDGMANVLQFLFNCAEYKANYKIEPKKGKN